MRKCFPNKKYHSNIWTKLVTTEQTKDRKEHSEIFTVLTNAVVVIKRVHKKIYIIHTAKWKIIKRERFSERERRFNIE